MSKLDLIVDALQLACHETYGLAASDCYTQALAAARELKALKPVGYMDSRGILFNKTTHPHLNTPLYALDEVTK
jgi:hypothetical protein